jgi:hypothetical protein
MSEWIKRLADWASEVPGEEPADNVIRRVLVDMNAGFLCNRCSWTRLEMYSVVREVIRLRARLNSGSPNE